MYNNSGNNSNPNDSFELPNDLLEEILEFQNNKVYHDNFIQKNEKTIDKNTNSETNNNYYNNIDNKNHIEYLNSQNIENNIYLSESKK